MDCLSTCVWTAWVRAYGLPGYVSMDCLGTCVWTASRYGRVHLTTGACAQRATITTRHNHTMQHNRARRVGFPQPLKLQKSFQCRISSAPQSHCATRPRGPNSAAPRHGRVVTPAHPPGTTTARPGLRNPAPAPHNRVAVGATAVRSHHSGARQPAPVCALRRIESKGVETGAASRSRRRRAVRAGGVGGGGDGCAGPVR